MNNEEIELKKKETLDNYSKRISYVEVEYFEAGFGAGVKAMQAEIAKRDELLRLAKSALEVMKSKHGEDFTYWFSEVEAILKENNND